MSRTFTFFSMTFWLCLVGVGLRYMAQYENASGVIGRPAPTWQANHLVTPRSNKPTLIMFAHPKCPCTRASLAELKRLLADCPDKVQVAVLFFIPANAAPKWTATALWKSAAAIPGVTVLQDENGTEAKRLRIETSGETLLYAPNGKLLFHGGITAGRGHEGSNRGRAALEQLLDTGMTTTQNTPVYGCPLYRSYSTISQEDESCRK